jgi:N-acetylglucosaminyldiphosphoundecaprenol N-acetyl-beta-D-mannosaminyltransferase
MSNERPKTARFVVLGVPVDAVQIPEVIGKMEQWISRRDSGRYIAVTNTHVVVEAERDRSYKQTLVCADLVVPDGMPLVWIGRRNGFDMPQRVYGPDLFEAFCRETHEKGYTHFFYGGAPGTPEEVARVLKGRYPGLRVVGTYSPPFRPMTREEDAQTVAMINRAAPDVLWVGLGCPKQERWMHEHQSRLAVPVMLGVGAAFDFLSGRTPQAPRWIRDHGLEWLYRLCKEPRRLWRRYLVSNSSFIYYCCLESVGLKRFSSGVRDSRSSALSATPQPEGRPRPSAVDRRSAA